MYPTDNSVCQLPKALKSWGWDRWWKQVSPPRFGRQLMVTTFVSHVPSKWKTGKKLWHNSLRLCEGWNCREKAFLVSASRKNISAVYANLLITACHISTILAWNFLDDVNTQTSRIYASYDGSVDDESQLVWHQTNTWCCTKLPLHSNFWPPWTYAAGCFADDVELIIGQV